MQGSGLAHPALRRARQTDRPLKATRGRAERDPLSAVLTVVLDDLARPWMRQTRRREARLSMAAGEALQRTNEETACKP